jgi:ComF family protein
VARSICTFSGPIRKAIHGFKYERKIYLGKTLVRLLEERPPPLDIGEYDNIVPVPLHRNRLRQRGYNQALLLGREMARRSGVPVEPRILVRIKDALPQIELTGDRREENVKGVFSLRGDPDDKTFLLVDDVYTTGATVQECAKILIEGGATKVDILTIARTM